MNNWILTQKGHAFSFDDVEYNIYDIDDIAHSLAMTCRYGGMSRWHYSVAQHSVLIAREIWYQTYDPSAALDGLMHDAEEAYMGDMKTPLKNLMPDFRAMSDRVDSAIRKTFAHYGVPATIQPLTKEYDTRILLDEKRALLPDDGPRWPIETDGTEPLGVLISRWTPQEAKAAFLDNYRYFTNEASVRQ
jgi:hypothetical protein